MRRKRVSNFRHRALVRIRFASEADEVSGFCLLATHFQAAWLAPTSSTSSGRRLGHCLTIIRPDTFCSHPPNTPPMNLKRFEILLPLNYNDGRPIERLRGSCSPTRNLSGSSALPQSCHPARQAPWMHRHAV